MVLYKFCIIIIIMTCRSGPSSAQSSTTYAKVSDLTIDDNPTTAAGPADAVTSQGTAGFMSNPFMWDICLSC